MEAIESKFERSRANRRVESRAASLLLADPRFQRPGPLIKRHILQLLGVPTDQGYGVRTFDLIMLPTAAAPLTVEGLAVDLDHLRLVEMKATLHPIRDEKLNGFFFGATENEFRLAQRLGDRYLFAFVVLNSDNVYGRPFAVLLNLLQVEARTRNKRTQYQVNFRTDMGISSVESLEVLVIAEPGIQAR